jgi:hypothetical protein
VVVTCSFTQLYDFVSVLSKPAQHASCGRWSDVCVRAVRELNHSCFVAEYGPAADGRGGIYG